MTERRTTGMSVQGITLGTLPLFAMLPPRELERIAGMAQGRRVARGTVVVHAGDSTDALYIILSGTAKVMIADQEGREVIFTMLGPGDFFGEMGLIDDEPRSADVVAAEACELVVILKEDFRRCLADNFGLTLHIMKGLVQRLRDANRKIESMALMDVYDRVAKQLLELSEVVNGRRVVRRRVTKQDIAKMVGASREMVSRVMKDLEASGHIMIEDRHVYLPEE